MAKSAVKELKAGDPAPEIKLATDEGTPLELSSLRGRKVVVYFYPKADTPGCTKEACSFRDESRKFGKLNAVILGISPDRTEAQAKFKTKYGLPFTLLADVDHAAAEAYGVWKEKSLYGRKFMGVERTTFSVGEDGKIARIFRRVKVDGHSDEVLAALKVDYE